MAVTSPAAQPGGDGRARKRAAVVLVAALTGVLATARLGVWQLDRAAQKVALQRALDERGGWPVLSQDALPVSEEAAKGQHHRRVLLRGTWVPAATVFLDNRQMNGRPGFFVVTPLRLSPPSPAVAGEARPRVVLVQRGWVPRDAGQRTRLPDVPAAAGEVEVHGLLAPPPARLFEFQAAASGPIRQNLDLAAFAAETGLPLQPYSVTQTQADGMPAAAGGDGLLRQWPKPAVDVHKHYGYAFQWFSLSALLAGLYLWFQILSPFLRAKRNRDRRADPSADETR